MQYRNSPEVIIDPGHGGSTAAGGSSPLGVDGHAGVQPGVSEKQVNLELARRVAARLGGLAALTR
ncbi:MAG: N-acetylmuramoyl-L-alanine amidase, partial [Myxococcales bacterium]|nr:N-acetylmuramoyl-L-alanine amidase [Myxococcales bacterium]